MQLVVRRNIIGTTKSVVNLCIRQNTIAATMERGVTISSSGNMGAKVMESAALAARIKKNTSRPSENIAVKAIKLRTILNKNRLLA